MTMTSIKIIPIAAPFLPTLAHFVHNKFKGHSPDLSSLLIIFPTQRNKLYFRRYLVELSANKAIIPPAMKTIRELMDEIYERLGGRGGMVLQKIERNFILKQVIDSLKVEFWKDLPFLRFIAVGDRLLKFFDELAENRLNLETIIAKVALGHYPERYIKDELPIIKRIYECYRKEVSSQLYVDEVDKYDTIYNGFEPELLNEYKDIIIAGVVATTSIENRVIQILLQKLPGELILHSSQEGLIRQTNTDAPFYQHHKLLNAIGAKTDAIQVIDGAIPPAPVFHIKNLATESQQIIYLANVLKELKGRYEPHRIAIILIDETLVFAVSELLRTSGYEFNISMGIPLTHSILYSFLNQLKEVIESNLHYQEFFDFIKHPLFKNGVVGSESLRPIVYQLQREMIKQKLNYYTPETITETRFSCLKKIISECINTVQANLSLNEYIMGIIQLLNTLLSYNQQLIKQSPPDIAEFIEKLDNLAKLRIPRGAVNFGIQMLDFILRILKDETLRIQGDPMRGIQVIGRLEARNLDFDCIIIPSLNEGLFPERNEKDLFINQPIRKEIGLPYDKERDSLCYYYFTEMISGKKEVYCSFIESEKKGEIHSRFIDFLTEQGHTIDDKKILLKSSTRSKKRKVQKEKGLLKRLIDKKLSPTSLKAYVQCPYSFYLRYLLRVAEPDEILESPTPMDWGSIIHQTLRNFYRDDFPTGLKGVKFSQALPLLQKSFYQTLKLKLAQTPKKVAYLDAEIYKKRLEKFLEFEIQRTAGDYKITTNKVEALCKYSIEVNGIPIQFEGYVDRVDIIDNKFYIIDYKTGASLKKKEYEIGPDFKEFQLPLYALAVSQGDAEKVQGIAYFKISKDVKVVPVVEGDKVKEYLADFQKEILYPTVQQILDPEEDFYQTDDKALCAQCSYLQLCGQNRA